MINVTGGYAQESFTTDKHVETYSVFPSTWENEIEIDYDSKIWSFMGERQSGSFHYQDELEFNTSQEYGMFQPIYDSHHKSLVTLVGTVSCLQNNNSPVVSLFFSKKNTVHKDKTLSTTTTTTRLDIFGRSRPKIIFKNIIHVSAFGESDGSVSIDVFSSKNHSLDNELYNDVNRFEVTWRLNGLVLNNSSKLLRAVSAGKYKVTVVDTWTGCSSCGSVVIKEPKEKQIVAPPRVKVVITDVMCSGGSDGSAVSSASGGTSPYVFEWADSSKTKLVGPQPFSSLVAVPAGTYYLTVTDANSIRVVTQVTIREPPPLVASVAVTDVLCNGHANGIAVVSVVVGLGGTPTNVTFEWFDEPSHTPLLSPNLPSPGKLVAGAGDYSVTVTDSDGCTVMKKFTISEPDSLSLRVSVTRALCFGGDGVAKVSSTGGTGPFVYKWTQSNGVPLSPQPNPIDTLTAKAGFYGVSVKDANNCTVSNNRVEITQPDQMNVTFQITNQVPGSNEGSVKVITTGGTPYTEEQYTYLHEWEDSNGALVSYQQIINEPAGTYYVDVTDANGCAVTAFVTIPLILPLQLHLVVNNGCDGTIPASAITSASGGIKPYTYEWVNTTSPNTDVTTSADDTIVNSIPVGEYTVTITDSSTPTLTSSQQFSIIQKTPLSVSFQVTDETCGLSNGKLTPTVSGGTAPFTYAWTGINEFNINVSSSSTNLENIRKGTYSLKVKDVDGCEVTEVTTIDNDETECTLFSNNTVMTIGPSASFSTSIINVPTNVTHSSHVSITLKGLTHYDPINLKIILEPPASGNVNNIVLMNSDGSGNVMSDLTLTFDKDGGAYPGPSAFVDHSVIVQDNFTAYDTTTYASDGFTKWLFNGTLSGLTSLSLVVGDWKLWVYDTQNGGQQGQLSSWEIKFS